MGGCHDKPGRPLQKPGRLRLDHGHPVLVLSWQPEQTKTVSNMKCLPLCVHCLFSAPFPSAINV